MGLALADVCTVGSSIGDTWALTGGVYTAAKGRFGRPALRLGGTASVVGAFPDTTDTTLHAVFSIEGGLGADQEIIGWLDGSTEQVKLVLRANLSLQLVKSSGGVVLATSSTLLSPNVNYHLQIRSFTDPAAGVIEMRLNGSSIPLISFTGNTRSSANSRHNRLLLLSPFSPSVNFSEICLLDNTTAGPTGYQGDLNLLACTITGDSLTANKNQFATTPAQSAGSHFLNISDNSDATFNSDATVGDIERYQIAMGISGVTAKFIATRFKAGLDTAGVHNVAPLIAQGVSESVGPDFSLGSTPAFSPWYASLNDPGTSAPWSSGGAATADVGVKVTL